MSEVVLLIGTRKGVVVARSDQAGSDWRLRPLQLIMSEVYGVGIDTRGGRLRLFAGAANPHWGPTVVHSDDLGESWSETDAAPIAFPEDTGAALIRVWQIQAASEREPGVVYAGVEPHALFRSEDGGISFELVRGLFDHPHRPEWAPGNGGACLHTVLPHPTDPQRMLVALSAGGVYRTFDGGATWEAANSGIQAYWMPEEERFPQFGQCVHKLAQHPDHPERVYAQNHFGVYRSDDYGTSWHPIESGLPSTFGFPVLAHPGDPETAFIFPLQADSERMPPDRACRIYRTQDGGASWHPLGRGLPQSGYHSAVLRDGMCTDFGDPAGVYFGTRNGEVFATRDAGESWELVAEHLPDVLSVRAAVVA